MRAGRGSFGWRPQPPQQQPRFLGAGIGSGVDTGAVGIGSCHFVGMPRGAPVGSGVGSHYHGNQQQQQQHQNQQFQPRSPQHSWPPVPSSDRPAIGAPPPPPAIGRCWAANGFAGGGSGGVQSKRGRYTSGDQRRGRWQPQPPPPPPSQKVSSTPSSTSATAAAALKALHQAAQEMAADSAAASAWAADTLLASLASSTGAADGGGLVRLSRAYCLLRDLHPVARRQVEEEAAADSVGPLTILCDLYVNEAFGCQGRGPSMWAAGLDASARLVRLLLGNRVLVIKPARRLGRDGRFEPVPAAIAGPNTPDPLPPLLWQPGPGNLQASVEARLGSVSCCLLGFQHFGRLVEDPTESVEICVVGAATSDSSSASLQMEADSAEETDDGDVGNNEEHFRWASDPMATDGGVLGNLFVLRTTPQTSATSDPVAALKATLRFNGIGTIEAVHVAEKFGVAAQLQLVPPSRCRHPGRRPPPPQLLALGEGPSAEAAVAAAAAEFLEAAGRHQPCVGIVDGDGEVDAVPVSRSELLATGAAAYAADPAGADRVLSEALSGRAGPGGGGSAWALLGGSDLWPELLRGQAGLADFANCCAAWLLARLARPGEAETTESATSEACREFGAAEFSFPEMCVVYCLCAVLRLRLDALPATATTTNGGDDVEGGSPPRQRLLVHRAAPPDELKRRLLRRGSFGRLRLLDAGPRAAALAAQLGV